MEPAMRRSEKCEVAIVVTPSCSLLSALLLAEPLRAANRLSESEPFDYYFASIDGKDVLASNGFTIPVKRVLSEVRTPTIACLVASYEQPRPLKDKLLKGFGRLARHSTTLCGVDLGVLFLVEAGLVGHRRVSVHWETLSSIQEERPEINASEELYSVETDLMTCGGHTASLDMMLAFIASQFGVELARAVSNEMLTSGIRPPATPQRHLIQLEPWTKHPVLNSLLVKMNEQIEQAPKIAELMRSVAGSRRQIEYLSKRYLGCSPSQYFLQLRLNRSRELLLYTNSSIASVATTCGFSATSSFSRSFREHFGATPTSYRRRWRTDFSRPYVK